VRTGISSAAILVIRDQSYGSSSAHFALSDSSRMSLHVVIFSNACFSFVILHIALLLAWPECNYDCTVSLFVCMQWSCVLREKQCDLAVQCCCMC
jgi:hypothetical protein